MRAQAAEHWKGTAGIYFPGVGAAERPCLAGVLLRSPSRGGVQCVSPRASGPPAQACAPTARGFPLTPPSVLERERELEKARELKKKAVWAEFPAWSGRGGFPDTPPSFAKKMERLSAATTLEEIQSIEVAAAHRSPPAAAATAAGERCAAWRPHLPGCSLGMCVCQRFSQHPRIPYQWHASRSF